MATFDPSPEKQHFFHFAKLRFHNVAHEFKENDAGGMDQHKNFMCTMLYGEVRAFEISVWSVFSYRYMRECTEISRKGAQGGRQKKLKKIMKKAFEKFRLPAPSSARSDLRLLRNRDLKIGTFSKNCFLKLCFHLEVRKCIKNVFVWAEISSEGIFWWALPNAEISGWSNIFVPRPKRFKMTYFQILISNFSFASARILLKFFLKKAAFYDLSETWKTLLV